MAYPVYNPYLAQPMQMNPQQNVPIQQNNLQSQNGGFIPVPNEEFARNYPVAPGNSVTFKNENAPYVYTKTMGFSQLDRPIFEKYKLVREDVVTEVETPKETVNDEIIGDIRKDVDYLKEEIDSLQDELNAIKEQTKKPANSRKRNDSGGDD
mgnify:CR=1 FL=1